MLECKPVSVPKAAFNFCKTSLAIIVWIALIFKLKWLLVFSLAILGASAILKIRRAPLILLYTHTVNRIFKSKNEILDENAMRFAHTLGFILNLICVILLYWVNDFAGWAFVLFFAVMKTSGALGHCSALKLYGCLSSGGCCRFIRRQDV